MSLYKDIMSRSCYIDYTFQNPSLGPVYGKQAIRVVMERGKIKSFINRKTNKPQSTIFGRPGWRIVQDFIKGNTKKYSISYTNRSYPIVIRPLTANNRIGNSFSVIIEDIRCK